ncbi:MAG: heparan-alpha-glucosaminide N-acetyltransferase domain-containing protein, partial [Ferruginibacter sp.]
MSTIPLTNMSVVKSIQKTQRTKRIESIDLLRGIVMIIMALDHNRDYFHKSAFIFSPEDLAQTNIVLFFTRWITHFCAPVFIFLAGISAYLYGAKKSKRELSFFLLTRGAWLVLAELFIISLFRTFNPSYHFFNLQVIWAIGISMIILSAIIHLNKTFILLSGILLIATHNLLDKIHVAGTGISSFLWALLHDPGYHSLGTFTFHIHYPLLPWIGVMAIGYYFGSLYNQSYDGRKRRRILLMGGSSAIVLFVLLRSGNLYGDPANWSLQKTTAFSIISFLNVTKYPPSLLYILMTIGPAMIFLSLSEKPLNSLTQKILIFGRVPMFYYLAHILLIHVLAVVGAVVLGYKWSDMILTGMVNSDPQLKGY